MRNTRKTCKKDRAERARDKKQVMASNLDAAKAYEIIERAWRERRFVKGMTREEIKDLCFMLRIKEKKFWEEYGVNTCGVDILTYETLYYYSDIERALAKILWLRKVKAEEWD